MNGWMDGFAASLLLTGWDALRLFCYLTPTCNAIA
jgi:hypothetical protein